MRDRLQQPLLVGRGIVQRRLGQSEKELLHQRIEFHRRPLGIAADEIAKPLAVLHDADVAGQPRLRRHLDHQVAQRDRLAGQHVAVANFVAGEELDGVALDFAVADDQPALAAGPLAAADRPHVDIGLPGGLQERLALVDRRFATFRQEADVKACHALRVSTAS